MEISKQEYSNLCNIIAQMAYVLNAEEELLKNNEYWAQNKSIILQDAKESIYRFNKTLKK